MANLTSTQRETLRRSTLLSNCFKSIIEDKATDLRNNARKLIKANEADKVYHEESFLSEQKAIEFQSFAQKYYRLLGENNSIENGMLVSIISKFDYPESLATKTTDSEILEVISVATYNHPALGEVNIFELIVDQAFEESQLKAISN